ncbi:MAG: RagB/SusD family nutrient uptake outer membrane protein [Bacteroidota bacterium]
MKRLPYIVSIFILLALSSSCDDFLEEETRGILAPSNFFNNDEEAIIAVNGVYRHFTFTQLYGNFTRGLFKATQYGADDYGLSRTFGPMPLVENYTISETDNGFLRDTWTAFYRAISDANVVIENVSGNTNLSEQTRNRAEGEAIFLRSLAYYHLTNIFGDVPYITSVLSLSEATSLGREEVSVVRQGIIADLTDVENRNLLSEASNATQVTRVSIWAAKALKAKVALWEGEWQIAFTTCEDIINNSQHSLMANYEDVFKVSDLDDLSANTEVIFAFDWLSGVSNRQALDAFNPRIADEPEDPAENDALVAALAANGDAFTGTGALVCLPDFEAEHPDDLRKASNIMRDYEGIILNFAYSRKLGNINDAQSPRFQSGDLAIVLRLGDVYLMAAEAANELGNASAVDYINAIRARAYEPDQPLSGLSQGDLRQAIRDERRWELAGEGQRRYDLIRWGILVETVRGLSAYPYEKVGATGADNIQERHDRLPIPAEELLLNPNLLLSDPTNNGYR